MNRILTLDAIIKTVEADNERCDEFIKEFKDEFG